LAVRSLKFPICGEISRAGVSLYGRLCPTCGGPKSGTKYGCNDCDVS
jgi:hypothetical protein